MRVVWSLPPQGDSGGPTAISRAAPHHEALPTSSSLPRSGRNCLLTGKPVRQLRDDDFAAVLAPLDGLAVVSASARHHARTRLLGLQHACFQLGGLSAPPRQAGPVAVGPAGHAAGVRQPLIRAEVVRYINTVATTLRPNTVAGRTKALRVFFDYLADHHPEVTRLDQIERTHHIEPYLC